MTASVKAVSTVKNNGGGGASLTFTRATDGLSGVADGDLLLAHIVASSSVTGLTISAPAGWTAMPASQIAADPSGTALTMRVFRRIASSEAASYTFTQNGGGANEGLIGAITVVQDHDEATPIHAESTPNTAGAGSASFTPNSCTTSIADTLVLTFVGATDLNSPGTITATNNDAEVYDGAADPGFALGCYATRVVKATAGTPTAQVFTFSAGTGIDTRAGYQIAIAPLANAGEGALEIDGVSSLDVSGLGHGSGDLDVSATATLDIQSMTQGQGELAISGVSVLALDGRPQDAPDELHLTAATSLAMEGQQVGGLTTVLTPGRCTVSMQGSAELEVGTVEDEFVGAEGEPVPPDPTLQIQRILRTAPSITAFLDDQGKPDKAAWTAAFANDPTRQDWGSVRVRMGGRWVSNFRGVPVQLVSWSEVEPFGDESAEIRFPQISPFEPLPSWCNDEANVTLYQYLPSGELQTLWEGLVASIEDDGSGVLVQCMGALFQANYYRNRARLTEHGPMDIGHLIARELTPNARDRRAFRCISINKANTGIEAYPSGGWEPILDYVEDLLSRCFQDDGDQWTVTKEFGRRPKMTLKDYTTEHYSIHAGEPGVEVRLRLDAVNKVTTIFGEGVSPDNCKWMNSKYPNIRYGDVPVFSGTLINPGDTHTDYGLFSQELSNRGWSAFLEKPGNTYDFSEEAHVRDFQREAGVQEDGVVGPQTWAAAFGVGGDASEVLGAFVHSLYSRSYTEAYFRAPDGAQTDPNPDFDSKRLRIERYENMGSPISKAEGTRTAKQEVLRDSDPGLMGTIDLDMDPPEISRFEIRAGRNIRLREYRGASPLLHIARKQVDWESGRVTLEVDEKARDHMTLAQMLLRDRETENPARRREVTRRNRKASQTRDDKPVWDCENGAGIIPDSAIYAGLWNVYRVPAGRNGTIRRSYFQVENPTQLAVGIFDRPMTPAQMLKGTGENAGNPYAYNNYWDQFGDELLVCWGGRDGGTESPAGWFPYDGPEDAEEQDVTEPTGILDDRGTWYWETTVQPWLWVALWVEPRSSLDNNIAFIQGRLYASNEAS